MIRYIWLVPLVVLLSACTGAVHQPPVLQKKVDYVIVEKSQNKMYLVKGDRVIRSYNIGLGGNPIGHKRQEGDMRTPEGVYMLTYKNPHSSFFKSIRINYPNEQDRARAAARGVSPGGDIVIHGMPNEAGNYMGPITPINWTQGCVAVRNHEMQQIWNLITTPIPIEIRP